MRATTAESARHPAAVAAADRDPPSTADSSARSNSGPAKPRPGACAAVQRPRRRSASKPRKVRARGLPRGSSSSWLTLQGQLRLRGGLPRPLVVAYAEPRRIERGQEEQRENCGDRDAAHERGCHRAEEIAAQERNEREYWCSRRDCDRSEATHRGTDDGLELRVPSAHVLLDLVDQDDRVAHD